MVRRGAMLPVWGAYIASGIALAMSAYSIWLEPRKLELQRDIAEANLQQARAVVQLTEWLEARDVDRRIIEDAKMYR